MTDLVFTHITAKLPGSNAFLINPYGLLFDEITASSLVKIDDKCNKLQVGTVSAVAAAHWHILKRNDPQRRCQTLLRHSPSNLRARCLSLT